jgi:hypothetical protein
MQCSASIKDNNLYLLISPPPPPLKIWMCLSRSVKIIQFFVITPYVVFRSRVKEAFLECVLLGAGMSNAAYGSPSCLPVKLLEYIEK